MERGGFRSTADRKNDIILALKKVSSSREYMTPSDYIALGWQAGIKAMSRSMDKDEDLGDSVVHVLKGLAQSKLRSFSAPFACVHFFTNDCHNRSSFFSFLPLTLYL
jgi:hypothetical protein